MIPYSLQFSGIRDYKPVKMTFGEAGEHVLITGPNGAGKSTITFAIGAVLCSSKVDIEGLRSCSLRLGQTWRAEVFLTFHNIGHSRIDAPTFIAFQLLIKQKPGSVIQRQFTVFAGESPEELTKIATYRSGDAQNRNLSMYRDDLQFKYKIQPDLFYLIWYQKEVNQFATMEPEERFRRFSEMYHIEEIQKTWETSVESLKDLEEELLQTKSHLKVNESQLAIAHVAYKRFKSNERTLEINGKNHVWLTLSIRGKLALEQSVLEQELKAKQKQLNGLADKGTVIANHLAQMKLRKDQKEQQNHQVELEIRQLKNRELSFHNQLIRLKGEIDHLRQTLASTEKLRKKLMFSEEETKTLTEQNKEKTTQLNLQLEENKEKLQQITKKIMILQMQKIEEEHKLKILKEQEEEHKKLLSIYKSSHEVEKLLDQNKKDFNDISKAIPREEEIIQRLKKEITMLQQNKVMSNRQQMAIQHLQSQGIKAFPIRDFIEMEEEATLKDEQLLDPIKYTIFYTARKCKPINDLYHVSLPNLVPTKFMENLPLLKLKIKDNLSDEQIIMASKALYWIDQFFKSQPKLEGHFLVDERGIRGPQERNTLILSKKALEKRLSELQNTLTLNEAKLDMSYQKQSEYEKKISDLQSVIKDVKKAEAFMLEYDKKEDHIKLIKALEEQTNQFHQTNEQIQDKIIEIQQQIAIVYQEHKFLQEQLEIFNKLGELKSEQQKLLKLEQQEKQLNLQRKENDEEKSKKGQLHQDLLDLISNLTRNIGRIVNDQESNKHALLNIEKKQIELEEQIQTTKTEITRNDIILKDLKEIIPSLYEEAGQEETVKDQTMPTLLSENERAKIVFEAARNADVDPHAEENYKMRKADYDKKKEDAQKIEELLEENKILVAENEQKLETTINKHVLLINKKFQYYMEQFNFDSEISWERFSDKRGRVVFKLYVKAHKNGHGNKLGDVSVKARNGKYGKGVSGGEESLSSLLFALSLLQHLEITPGYIILDEFDSALDEIRKEKVFELFASELQRKLIILSPKAHDDQYYAKYSRVFIVQHDATKVESTIKGIQIKSNVVV